MPPSLHRAPISDACTLAQLFQYYVYDLSDVVNADLDVDGRYTLPSLDAYWVDPWRHPFLVRVEGKLAGFALVHQKSRITGDMTTWDVAEFFVMRKYRRQGVGAAIATQLFDSFRGAWEVRQLLANQAATSFWRRVIGDYTRGQFTEITLDDERWRGPVQSFRN
jgi:predicted acetyltransferase